MTSSVAPTSEFFDLMCDLAEDRISPPQAARLEELLWTNPANRCHYVDFMLVIAGLHRTRGEVASDQWLVARESEIPNAADAAVQLPHQLDAFNPQSPIPNPSLPPSPAILNPLSTTLFSFPTTHSFVFSYLIAALLVGVGLLIAWAWKLPGAPEIAQLSLPPVKVVPEPKMAYVGRITGMVDCKWEKKGLGIRDWGLERGAGDGENDKRETINDKLSVQHSAFSVQRSSNPQSLVSLGDKFALASGLMEITYNTGAKVILQGPCTYETVSVAGGFLSIGKLTAKVDGAKPQVANHKSEIINQKSSLSTIHYPLFTIKTPTAIVTDLGTEFGVEVSKEGHTTSHVFRGSVEVQMVASDGKTEGVAQVLHENQSVRMEGNDRNRRIVLVPTFTPSNFIREIPKPTIKTLDLVEMVVGGEGFSGRREGGIVPDSGRVVDGPLKPRELTLTGDGLFHRVHGLPFVDGVFIPNGEKNPVQINSSGLMFAGFPGADNHTYRYIHISVRGHRALLLPISAEIITVTPADGNTGISHTDLFEGASITGSANIHPISDARDLFGGAYGSVEPGTTLGADDNAVGDWSVSFHTAAPVTIGGFNLFLAQDGDSNHRAARGFAFYKGGSILAQGTLATDYTASYGNPIIKVAVALDSPHTASDWKLVVRNANKAGARALELDAIAGAPDPSTLAMTANGVLSLPANKGISFDLDSIRHANSGWKPVRFLATAGNTTSIAERGNDVQWSDIWLIVDGQLRLKRRGLGCDGAAMPISIALGDHDHFLTLAGTDEGNDHQWNWTMFGDPRLEVEQTRDDAPRGKSQIPSRAKEGLPRK